MNHSNWKIVPFTVTAILLSLTSACHAFDANATIASGKISDIQVLNLHFGPNEIDLFGIQKRISSVWSTGKEQDEFVKGSGLIMIEATNPTFGDGSNWIYFSVAGTGMQSAIFFSDTSGYFLQGSSVGERSTLKSASFFQGIWDGHEQTFIIYANRYAVDRWPSKAKISLYDYVPPEIDSYDRIVVAPTFELIKAYDTTYNCLSSDVDISIELTQHFGFRGDLDKLYKSCQW